MATLMEVRRDLVTANRILATGACWTPTGTGALATRTTRAATFWRGRARRS